MEYQRRIVDDFLDEMFEGLPAISIEGAKGVGKTETARQRSATTLRLDDPATAELIAAAPDLLSTLDTPLLLDEWQRIPSVWDSVRRMVDDDFSGGRFLLTGSSRPAEQPMHSGAGRIVTVRMRPMSVAERGIEDPTVSLRNLLEGGADIAGRTNVGLPTYIEEICSSGFPGIRGSRRQIRAKLLDGYLERIAERDFPEAGLRVRRPELLRAWLTSFAAATGTTTSYNQIGMHAIADGTTPARGTTEAYRTVLESLWLLDQVPGWTTGHNLQKRLLAAPKHFLADPALAARLLNIDEERLSRAESPADYQPHDGSVLGNLFEALVALSLQTYAMAAEASLSHFRSQDGAREVDFIVHRGDMRNVAVEVKLKRSVDDRDVRHLHWLKEALGDRLTDLVIITTGPFAYRRQDGVAVVPLALLGP